jgi:hypothetical protein
MTNKAMPKNQELSKAKKADNCFFDHHNGGDWVHIFADYAYLEELEGTKAAIKNSSPDKKAGKNHAKINGRLLQTNKKWSHLKGKQKSWIYDTAKREYDRFVSHNKRIPEKSGKDKLLTAIKDKINERGIWLPYHELDANLSKFIARLNRKIRQVYPIDRYGYIVGDIADKAGGEYSDCDGEI